MAEIACSLSGVMALPASKVRAPHIARLARHQSGALSGPAVRLVPARPVIAAAVVQLGRLDDANYFEVRSRCGVGGGGGGASADRFLVAVSFRAWRIAVDFFFMNLSQNSLQFEICLTLSEVFSHLPSGLLPRRHTKGDVLFFTVRGFHAGLDAFCSTFCRRVWLLVERDCRASLRHVWRIDTRQGIGSLKWLLLPVPPDPRRAKLRR